MSTLWTIKTTERRFSDKCGYPTGTITTKLFFGEREMAEKTGEMGHKSLKELCDKYNLDGYAPPEECVCMVDVPLERRKKMMVKHDKTPYHPFHGKDVQRYESGNVIRGEDGEPI